MTNESPSPGCCAAPAELSRRRFLEKVCLGLGGLCAALLGIPIVGFVLAPLFRTPPAQWVPVGPVTKFVIGSTVNVTLTDPSSLPWAGISAKTAAWLRRVDEKKFIAFAVNCTHMGCPVRWLADASLFMCPCHGGVYYGDGTVAAGPPPKPLDRHEVRVSNGQVEIKASRIPITHTL
ncbi:MAG: ubiquinol-cytochrome c reductase iron-sulfur subunit [Chthoniobacterales bacterium]